MLAAIPPLAFVLGLAALAARLVRGFGWRPAASAMADFTIVNRTRLDRTRVLYQVRRGNRNILLLAGGGADLVVDRWDADPPGEPR